MQNKKVNEKKLFREILNIQDIPGHFEKLYEIPGVSRSFQEIEVIPGYSRVFKESGHHELDETLQNNIIYTKEWTESKIFRRFYQDVT